MSASGPREAVSTEVVLFSGGIDSAALAGHLLARGQRPELLFVDYGQRAGPAERDGSQALATHWGLALTEITVGGYSPGDGQIPGRNALLVHLALAHRPHTTRFHLGIHAGTGYADCSLEFVELMQRSLDFHTGGETRLSAPFLDLSKADVATLAHTAAVPLDLTHSCEVGAEPCGRCLSCGDREALGLR